MITGKNTEYTEYVDRNLAIQTNNLGISFRMPSEPISGTKDLFIKAAKRKIKMNTFWALRHVTFELSAAVLLV